MYGSFCFIAERDAVPPCTFDVSRFVPSSYHSTPRRTWSRYDFFFSLMLNIIYLELSFSICGLIDLLFCFAYSSPGCVLYFLCYRLACWLFFIVTKPSFNYQTESLLIFDMNILVPTIWITESDAIIYIFSSWHVNEIPLYEYIRDVTSDHISDRWSCKVQCCQ